MDKREKEEQISLKEVAKLAASLLPADREENLEIHEKDGKGNVSSKYDLLLQERIIEELKKAYPDASYLSEENFQEISDGNGDMFIIDPIDGTTNFVNGVKFSSISIARLKDKEVVEAVVYNPYLDDLFYASKGEGAELNGKTLRVQDIPLSDSIVGFTQLPYDKYAEELIFGFGKRLFENCLDFRRMGSSALEICYAACGRYNAYCEMILFPWDYAAASLIVKEAGGKISDLSGNELGFDKRYGVVAGPETVHREIVELYKDYIEEKGETVQFNEELFR